MGRSATGSAESPAGVGLSAGPGPGPGRGPGFAVSVVEFSVPRDLDHRDLAALRARLDQVLVLRPRRVVIDLAGCTHLDATAIGLLLDVHRRLWSTDGLLSLRSPGPRLRKILEVARVDHVLDIVTDEAAA